ncbi:hypothetical protein FIBSPDRAFT_886654 [Athelia psychrophila]|uniref:Uncharacterized protein n=1 Tax=Athelia psychrophila TaxID=1759441 RepID=A0A166QQR7_9AGAM|nr:hypothetical protein FIBSPDRAFT_886654 [Fibularhizoctonia sp. CBS 109695]
MSPVVTQAEVCDYRLWEWRKRERAIEQSLNATNNVTYMILGAAHCASRRSRVHARRGNSELHARGARFNWGARRVTVTAALTSGASARSTRSSRHVRLPGTHSAKWGTGREACVAEVRLVRHALDARELRVEGRHAPGPEPEAPCMMRREVVRGAEGRGLCRRAGVSGSGRGDDRRTSSACTATYAAPRRPTTSLLLFDGHMGAATKLLLFNVPRRRMTQRVNRTLASDSVTIGKVYTVAVSDDDMRVLVL